MSITSSAHNTCSHTSIPGRYTVKISASNAESSIDYKDTSNPAHCSAYTDATQPAACYNA